MIWKHMFQDIALLLLLNFDFNYKSGEILNCGIPTKNELKPILDVIINGLLHNIYINLQNHL